MTPRVFIRPMPEIQPPPKMREWVVVYWPEPLPVDPASKDEAAQINLDTVTLHQERRP